MCLPLSICITQDERVLARPGLHHHSDLVRAFFSGPARRGFSGDADLVGAEVNLRRKVVVLDESGLPPWYGPRHDDAVWRWVEKNLVDQKRYRSWLGLELVTAWAPKILRRDTGSLSVVSNREQNLPYLLGPLDLLALDGMMVGSRFGHRVVREEKHIDRILSSDPDEVRPLEDGFLEELVEEIEEEHRAEWAHAWSNGDRWRTSRDSRELYDSRFRISTV